MTRLRGRAPKGQRLLGKAPHGHWKLTTFIAAPMVIDRPMNGAIFLAYVLTFLLPTLAKGDIVVMDNLAVHKVAGVVEAIEGAGARVLYLPPYSPDLNPTEQMFAKLGRDNEYWPTCADEFWPPPVSLTCCVGLGPDAAGRRHFSLLPVMV